MNKKTTKAVSFEPFLVSVRWSKELPAGLIVLREILIWSLFARHLQWYSWDHFVPAASFNKSLMNLDRRIRQNHWKYFICYLLLDLFVPIIQTMRDHLVNEQQRNRRTFCEILRQLNLFVSSLRLCAVQSKESLEAILDLGHHTEMTQYHVH